VKPTSSTVLVRLKRRAKGTGRTVAETIQYYAMERLLYRLGESRHREHFVLKGAMMLRAWDEASARPTRDIDLLAFASNDLDSIRHILAEICRMDVDDDAVSFDADSIQMELIKEFDDYQGARAKFQARLETAKIPMQLDIGFGDSVHPEPVWSYFPTILGSAPPRVRMYSRASVVSEKLHAMVKLGAINSRMKDYHDIWFLSMHGTFDSNELSEAIGRTFRARKTAIPARIDGLSDEFERYRAAMWDGFLRREPGLAKVELSVVMDRLRTFLLPCLLAHPASQTPPRTWDPTSGAWIPSQEQTLIPR